MANARRHSVPGEFASGSATRRIYKWAVTRHCSRQKIEAHQSPSHWPDSPWHDAHNNINSVGVTRPIKHRIWHITSYYHHNSDLWNNRGSFPSITLSALAILDASRRASLYSSPVHYPPLQKKESGLTLKTTIRRQQRNSNAINKRHI